MRYIIIIVCILAALILAFLCISWLRNHTGTGEDVARVYAVTKGRNKNFWSFHYFPVILSVLAVSVAIGLCTEWKQSAACIAGAAAVFIPVIAGSFSFNTGIAASYFNAMGGDIRQSLRSGYRTGAVLGSLITGICLFAVLALLYITKSSEAGN